MKYIFLCLFVVGCTVKHNNDTVSNRERLKNEAKAFCSCHGGLHALVMADERVSLVCKDGSNIEASPNATIVGCD